MSAARVPIVPRLVGSLDTFTVSQVDSFIAIRRVINLEIIWWRQPVHRRFYGRQRDVFAAVLSRVKVYQWNTRNTYTTLLLPVARVERIGEIEIDGAGKEARAISSLRHDRICEGSCIVRV